LVSTLSYVVTGDLQALIFACSAIGATFACKPWQRCA